MTITSRQNALPTRPARVGQYSALRSSCLLSSAKRGSTVAPALKRFASESILSDDSGDDNGEGGFRSMPERIFTFKRWDVHRNSKERYARHISGMLTSSTWRNLTTPLSSITLFAVLNGCYQTAMEQGVLPSTFPSLQLSDGPLELTSFALALLLVFRTDSSYSRWMEAMDVWTKVRTTCKDIVRYAACWIEDPALLSAIVRWTVTYTHSLMVYLREKSDISTATARLLLKHEHAQFCNLCRDTSTAYPQYALQVLTQAVTRAGLSSSREDKLLNSIAILSSCVSSCEKVLRYPIPLSYTRHTSRFMVIWLSVLPFALWDDVSWMSVPITLIIGYLLLGIDEIGVQIEEPFSLLPLHDFLADIERDLMFLTASRKEVSDLLDTSLRLTTDESIDDVAAAMVNKCREGSPVASNAFAPLTSMELSPLSSGSVDDAGGDEDGGSAFHHDSSNNNNNTVGNAEDGSGVQGGKSQVHESIAAAAALQSEDARRVRGASPAAGSVAGGAGVGSLEAPTKARCSSSPVKPDQQKQRQGSGFSMAEEEALGVACDSCEGVLFETSEDLSPIMRKQ